MTQVKISAAAQQYLSQKIAQQQALGLRLSVKKTGCSGFSYLPTLAKEKPNTDIEVVVDNVIIYLDTSWIHMLDDIEIDYIEDEKTGLKQKRLMITNSKEAGRCGCGESFHIE